MLSAPELLTAHHACDPFDSGVASLDAWLKTTALGNQTSGASRTYVVCEEGRVVGYYALASGAVTHDLAPGRVRRNMPNPVPMMMLGRLAVASSHHGQGLGRALFRDAAKRVLQAADIVGVRGLLVHAISEEAKAFYLRLGLMESPLEPLTLMTTMADLRLALSDS